MLRFLSFFTVFVLGVAAGALAVIYIPGIRERVVVLFEESSSRVLEAVKNSPQKLKTLLSNKDDQSETTTAKTS